MSIVQSNCKTHLKSSLTNSIPSLVCLKRQHLDEAPRVPTRNTCTKTLVIWATEKLSTLIRSFFLHLTNHAQQPVTALRSGHRSYITPHPKGTRFRLFQTRKKGSSVIHLHQIFDNIHLCKFIVLDTSRMRLVHSSPRSYSLLIQISLILGTYKIAARILITKPKGTILCCWLSSWFTV
jgi:hypothetical protein